MYKHIIRAVKPEFFHVIGRNSVVVKGLTSRCYLTSRHLSSPHLPDVEMLSNWLDCFCYWLGVNVWLPVKRVILYMMQYLIFPCENDKTGPQSRSRNKIQMRVLMSIKTRLCSCFHACVDAETGCSWHSTQNRKTQVNIWWRQKHKQSRAIDCLKKGRKSRAWGPLSKTDIKL